MACDGVRAADDGDEAEGERAQRERRERLDAPRPGFRSICHALSEHVVSSLIPQLAIVNSRMRAPPSRWLCASALLALSCAGPPTSPPLPAPLPPPPPVASREPPVGWPYWAPEPVTHVAVAAPLHFPLRREAVALSGGAKALWEASGPMVQDALLERGFASAPAPTRAFGVGDLYLAQVCADIPTLVTVDALAAVSFLVLEAALAEAETRVTLPAMKTLLTRLGTRLAAAEPGIPPDLAMGLRVVEAVVAVGRALLDPTYAPPDSVRFLVVAELALIRAHAGPASSPILHTRLDYATFAPRGAWHQDAAAPYLAAQWLSVASLDFDAAERSGHVDMSFARARTRGALLVARLLFADGDAPAYEALSRIDRLGELAFGDSDEASPARLARFAIEHGFDPHDSNAIKDPAALDKARRSAAVQLGGMEILPLRRSPDVGPWEHDMAPDHGLTQPPSPLSRWISSLSADPSSAGRHASFYASALDVLSTFQAPSWADTAYFPVPEAPWVARKESAVLAAWTLLRHDTVPFARVRLRKDPLPISQACVRPDLFIVVEPHPEALAALLGLTRQVSAGLAALGALGDGERALLVELEAILKVALTAALEEASGSLHVEGSLATVPQRLAAIEALIVPSAGPFLAAVLRDPKSARVLTVGTTGWSSLYAIVPDPRTHRPVLSVGAALAIAERWVPEGDDATDSAWGANLQSLR